MNYLIQPTGLESFDSNDNKRIGLPVFCYGNGTDALELLSLTLKHCNTAASLMQRTREASLFVGDNILTPGADLFSYVLYQGSSYYIGNYSKLYVAGGGILGLTIGAVTAATAVWFLRDPIAGKRVLRDCINDISAETITLFGDAPYLEWWDIVIDSCRDIKNLIIGLFIGKRKERTILQTITSLINLVAKVAYNFVSIGVVGIFSFVANVVMKIGSLIRKAWSALKNGSISAIKNLMSWDESDVSNVSRAMRAVVLSLYFSVILATCFVAVSTPVGAWAMTTIGMQGTWGAGVATLLIDAAIMNAGLAAALKLDDVLCQTQVYRRRIENLKGSDVENQSIVARKTAQDTCKARNSIAMIPIVPTPSDLISLQGILSTTVSAVPRGVIVMGRWTAMRISTSTYRLAVKKVSDSRFAIVTLKRGRDYRDMTVSETTQVARPTYSVFIPDSIRECEGRRKLLMGNKKREGEQPITKQKRSRILPIFGRDEE